MKSVFISHSSLDKRFALRLANDLKINNIKVWIFEADINIGDSLITELQKAINKTNFLLVILSPQAVKSNWVKKEVELALFKEISGKRIKVLPILWKKCEIPSFLKGKIYADFQSNQLYEKNFPRLVCKIHNLSANTINELNVIKKVDKSFALKYFISLKHSENRRISRYVFGAIKSGYINISQIKWKDHEAYIDCQVPNNVVGSQDKDIAGICITISSLLKLVNYLPNNKLCLSPTGNEVYYLLEPWQVEEDTWISHWYDKTGPYQE